MSKQKLAPSALVSLLSGKATVLVIIFTVMCLNCFARAGGFNPGMRFWELILFLFLLPFFLIYMLVRSIILSSKKAKAKKLAHELEIIDPVWSNRSMSARAQEIFIKVQEAWMERNMDLARDYITDNLYTNYKTQTDDMLKKGVKNIIRDIRISNTIIFSIEDFKDNNRDTFSAKISGTMVDYEVLESVNAVIRGSNTNEQYFEDTYTFTRQRDTWLADVIHNGVSIREISKGHASTEG